MMDLIFATIGLSLGGAVWSYFLIRDAVFSISLALFGCSTSIPVFLHLKYNLGESWLVWFGLWICLILYLKKKYPERMKKWEKSFPIRFEG